MALDQATQSSPDVDARPLIQEVAKLEESLQKAMAELEKKDGSRIKDLEGQLAQANEALEKARGNLPTRSPLTIPC